MNFREQVAAQLQGVSQTEAVAFAWRCAVLCVVCLFLADEAILTFGDRNIDKSIFIASFLL